MLPYATRKPAEPWRRAVAVGRANGIAFSCGALQLTSCSSKSSFAPRSDTRSTRLTMLRPAAYSAARKRPSPLMKRILTEAKQAMPVS